MASKYAGRSTSTFRTLSTNLRVQWKAQRRPCCRCGQPIDYGLDREHAQSFTVEHLKPRSTHPHLAEDPGNMAPAHRSCNSSRGNKPEGPSIGVTSRSW